MDELKIRGLVFTYIRGFLQQKLDEKEFKDFLSSLPEHLRELLKGDVLETQHYPLEYHHEIVNEIHEKLSEKAPEIVSKLGEFVIKSAQEGPFKILFATGDLKDYFLHIGSFTFKYFYSFGNFIIREFLPEEKKIIVHLTDIPIKTLLFEEGIKGALKGAAEVKGLKNVEVDITKRITEGDELIEYIITWE